jgi:hypothetical protein
MVHSVNPQLGALLVALVIVGGVLVATPQARGSALATLSWTLASSSGPAPRYGAAIAYDQTADYTVLFGGLYVGPTGYPVALNDTWIYQNQRWTNITSTAGPAPSPRAFASFTYDRLDGYMLLIGGQDPTLQVPIANPNCDVGCNDTWSFSQGHWNVIPPQAPSGLRYLNGGNLVATFDTSAGYVLVAAGSTYEYKAGDLIDLSYNASTNVTARTPEYAYPILLNDPTEGGVLMLGGTSIGCPNVDGGPCPVASTSTWLFSEGRWTNITDQVGLLPAPRILSAGGFDESNGQVVVFGGATGPYAQGYPAVGGTWILTNGTWVNATVGQQPPAMAASAMTWDAADHEIVMFGGLVNLPHSSQDTWAWGAAGGTSPLLGWFGLPGFEGAGLIAVITIVAIVFLGWRNRMRRRGPGPNAAPG